MERAPHGPGRHLLLTCRPIAQPHPPPRHDFARHLRRLNLNLRGDLPTGSILHFDELETYEGRRNTRPLSVPVLIERQSRYLIWAEAAPIRPRGKMTEARKRAIREDELRFGRRHDLSVRSVRRTLRRGADLAQLAEWYASGDLRPLVDRTFELADVVDAMRYVERGHVRGKVVLRMT